MNGSRSPWERPGYADLVAVEPAADAVRVRFADEDEIEIKIETLGLGAMAQFSIDEEGGALIARDDGGEREIDWMVLRSLSDPAFAEEVRRRDAEEARRIGRRLRALRENRGISQKSAAQMAQMSPPQLSKLEKGDTDMRLSTIRSVLRALDASLGDISGPDAPEVSVKELTLRAKKAKAPVAILDRIASRVTPAELPEVFERGFGWNPGALIKGVPDTPELDVQVAFSRKPKSEVRRSPLVRLARTLSELTASQYRKRPAKLSNDPHRIREEVIQEGGELSLKGLLEWAWNRGVIVIPMSGPGFSAAAWYVEKRPIIVIKPPLDLIASWLFVLAHELGHLALGHVAAGKHGREGVVDDDDVTRATAGNEEAQEKEANEFALELLLPGREPLFEEIRRRSGTSLQSQKQKFKWKAKDVAEEAGVSVPLLALAAAYALTDIAEPRDRWGSAVNLAKAQGPAQPTAVSAFEERVSLDGLSELDAALVKAVVLE